MEDINKMSDYDEQVIQINYLLQDAEGREYIKQNFEKIKKLVIRNYGDVSLNNFFEFVEKLKEIPEFLEEYEEYHYWAELYQEIQILPPEIEIKDPLDIFRLKSNEIKKLTTFKNGREVKNLVFTNILLAEDPNVRQEKAIVLQEKAKGGEYSFKGAGSSSLIIQSGEQVVKLGLGRRKFEIPYHPRIMMPYFRKKYHDGTCLEIFDYGNVESSDITDEKVLEIYKELEDAGIIWGDASKRNLAVLLKDNDLPDYIVSQDFNVLGFLEDEKFPTNHHVSLKTGDIVVCDLDMLYAKDDPECMFGDIDDIIEEYLMMKRMKAQEEYQKKNEREK